MKWLLTAFIASAFSITAHPQGTVWFSNIRIGAVVYESDGVTRLSGPQFMAELVAGPSASSTASIATTEFLTGNGAGYFDGGTQAISSVLPGDQAWVQVNVWNTALGASFLQAQGSGLPNAWWQSPAFTVMTGGVPSGGGPTLPALLLGLGNSPVYLNGVPEPSAVALAVIGGALALLRAGRLRPERAPSRSTMYFLDGATGVKVTFS